MQVQVQVQVQQKMRTDADDVRLTSARQATGRARERSRVRGLGVEAALYGVRMGGRVAGGRRTSGAGGGLGAGREKVL